MMMMWILLLMMLMILLRLLSLLRLMSLLLPMLLSLLLLTLLLTLLFLLCSAGGDDAAERTRWLLWARAFCLRAPPGCALFHRRIVGFGGRRRAVEDIGFVLRQRRIVRPGIVDRGGSALDVAVVVLVVVSVFFLATRSHRRSIKVLFLLQRRRRRRRLELSLVYLLLLMSLWILVLLLELVRNPCIHPTAVSDHLLFLFDVGRRAFDSPHDFVVGPSEIPHGGVDGRGALFEKVLEFYGQHPVGFGFVFVLFCVCFYFGFDVRCYYLFPFPQSNETRFDTITNYRPARPLHILLCFGR